MQTINKRIMERKNGDLFLIGGEKYIVCKSIYENYICDDCDLSEICACHGGNGLILSGKCSSEDRSDRLDVVFKKAETK